MTLSKEYFEALVSAQRQRNIIVDKANEEIIAGLGQDRAPKLYRKKPVVIRAMRWNGDNHIDIFKFVTGSISMDSNEELVIITLEGPMRASKGDYIIEGIKGEFYPCKPDIFEMTYENYERIRE